MALNSYQLKPIVDGYFTYVGTKPLMSYSESTIKNIVNNASELLVRNVTGTGTASFTQYILNNISKYGVEYLKAVNYLNAYPEKLQTIINYANEYLDTNTDSTGNVLKNIVETPINWVSNVVTDIAGNTLGSLVRKVLPYIIILAVLYLGFKYMNKKTS